MIAAVASDLGIGKDGKLLFHIKEDMAWFRSHTLHNVVVMGRKTLESFPGGRPLPERTHIVLSHKKHENTENVIWVTSVEEALAKMEKLSGDIYVTGGEQVYREFLPLASKLYLTEVAEKCDADAYFPDFLPGGEWKKMEENKHFTIDWTNCRLCPRECGADRTRGFGACKVGNTITAARAALHMWEEPCISGDEGSGAVFFSGCNLGCVYCQNREIALGHSGRTITQDRLCEIYIELQEKKANNINLVTAGHYLPIVIESIKRARKSGLTIPIVYNSSGYEKVEAIEALDGIVDIFLPDFKYISSEMAARYSNAPDYPEVAKRALAQMVKQTGDAKFDERDMMKRGVIVRHLILPGHIKESKEAIRYLYETYGDQVYISIMNQYTPMPGIEKRFKNLGRTITQKEYDEVVDYAIDLGVENGFIQEGETAKESFIPQFDDTGL